jgi:1-deoxy-D-xylulose-5-phosphate synthase
MIIAAPKDEIELRNMMLTAKNYQQGPFSIRYPRGRGCQINWKQPMEEMPVGKGRCLIKGENLAILSLGAVGCDVDQALKLLSAEMKPSFYDLRFLKPIDLSLIEEVFKNYENIITIEDGAVKGGLASEIDELAIRYHYKGEIKHLGVPDEFIEHGKPEELKKICNYDVDGIIDTIRSFY